MQKGEANGNTITTTTKFFINRVYSVNVN